jgi:hypothetical protein
MTPQPFRPGFPKVNRVISLKWLLLHILFMVLLVVGCESNRAHSGNHNQHSDRVTLQQCIKLMDSGAIHTTMDTNAVRRLFGDWVWFVDDNRRAIAQLYDPHIPPGVQNPGWKMYFTISKSGFVTWYDLTNASNK